MCRKGYKNSAGKIYREGMRKKYRNTVIKMGAAQVGYTEMIQVGYGNRANESSFLLLTDDLLPCSL